MINNRISARGGATPVTSHREVEPDRVDIGQLFATLWRQKWIVIAAAVVGAMLFAATAAQITPRYAALSKVMLDSRKRQVLAGERLVSDLELSERVINSEVSVLRSNVLLEDVIRTIGVDQLAVLDPVNASSSGGGFLGFGGGEPDIDPAVLEAAKIERLVWAVRRDLQVYREGDSYVIGVRMEAVDPVLAAKIADTVVAQYIQNQLDGRSEFATRASSWLTQRVDELRDEVQTAEMAVESYRAETLLLDGSSLDAVLQQIASLNNQLVLSQADLVAAEARYNQIANVFENGGMDAVADIVSSPLVEELNAERVKLAREDAALAEELGASHPMRQRALLEIERLERDIREEVARIVEVRRSEVEIARLREQTMASSLENLEAQIASTSQSSIGLRQLEREAAATRKIYENLLARLNETRTEAQLQEADATQIERATVPGAPASPRPKLLTAVGFVLGGIVGLCIVFVLELTSTRFRTQQELERSTGLPTLAAIPLERWGSPAEAVQELADDPYSAYAERIRHLRTALMLQAGANKQSILLVSSGPNEGKTTTAVSLAKMSAIAGKSVIVVDADLRRSAVQKSFGWKMEYDFADFIRDRCTIDQAIHSDPELGFDVLAATSANPEEADQLSASWLQPLIEDLKKVYDVVIVDAPALLAVSDALVLAQAVDTTVFVVRWDRTTRSNVSKGLSPFNEMRLPVAGTILTMVDARRSPEVYTQGYGTHA